MTYPHQQYLAERPDGHTLDGIPGDCFRTCVGILLDTNPETLPHFVMHGAKWWDVTRRTIRQITDGAYDLNTFTPSPWPLWNEPDQIDGWQRLAIATGPSPRGPFPHCVVIDSITGDFVHDPHPSGDGLAGPIVQVDLLVPLYDPAPAEPIALPAGPLDRVAALIGAGQLHACSRSGKPMTKADAAVLLEFHELPSNQPPKENR